MPGPITEYTGTPPALNQTQPEFDQNTQDLIDWVVNVPGEINAFSEDLTNLPTSATSATSNTIGTGSKAFTIETGKGIFPGQSLTIARTSAPTNRMFTVVDSYDSGTGALVVTSQAFAGSGTFTDWTITLGFNGQISAEQLPDEVVTNAKLAFDGGAFGYRNKIRNGDFRVNQTGLIYTSTSLRPNNDAAYTVDGWKLFSDGNDIVDVYQDAAYDATGRYGLKLEVETIDKKFGIAQIIEARDCVDFIGQSVTLSFNAKVAGSGKLDNVKAALIAWSGTADTITNDLISAWNVEGTDPTLVANATYESVPANLAISSTDTRYSITANIDTASAKNVILFVWSDVTDTDLNDTLSITEVQVEEGPTATPFERKPFDFELAWAERFLSVFSAAEGLDNVLGAGVVATTTIVRIVWSYKRPLRKAPTALLSSGVANFEVTNGAVRTPTVIAFSTAGIDGAQIAFTVGSALTANTGAYAYAVNVSALLILTGAEL
jgi:hypothetical protein